MISQTVRVVMLSYSRIPWLRKSMIREPVVGLSLPLAPLDSGFRRNDGRLALR